MCLYLSACVCFLCNFIHTITIMHTSLKFKDDEHAVQLQRFVFGENGVQPRLDFLKTAKKNSTTVDVITSGSAIDVTRTIELLGLRDYFNGVYQHCKTNKEVTSYYSGKLVHSATAQLAKTKGNIISKILKDEYNCEGLTVFLDDTLENGNDCSEQVEFLHVKNTEFQTVDTTGGTVGWAMDKWLALPEIKQIIPPEPTTFTTGISPKTFQLLIERINTGEIQHIFLDWDDCFQILCAPYPLEFPTPESQAYAGGPETFYKIPKDHFIRWLPHFLTERGFEVVVYDSETSLLKGFEEYK